MNAKPSTPQPLPAGAADVLAARPVSHWSAWRGVIDCYARYLPVSAATPVITLQEGNTPLIRADNFVQSLGVHI